MTNRFSRLRPWRPSWIFDRNDFSFFDLQVTHMLSTDFRVNWHLGLGEEAINRFSRWLPWRLFWIYNRHDFSFI